MKKNYLLKVMALLMTLLLMCMPMKTFAAEEEEKVRQSTVRPEVILILKILEILIIFCLKRKITFISTF